MQSKRVIATISMIVRTPRPSSPTIQASAPRSSVSLEAFETLPILRFRRSTCSGFLVPSGRQRGSRKHVSPPGACASTRNASHIGAETKYLWPTSSYASPGPSAPIGYARVVLARTSEPPCFSVIAMPIVSPCLSRIGHVARVVDARGDLRFPAPSRVPGSVRSDGTAAKVIVIGQPCPASTCVCM